MNLELFILGGYGHFVWPAFFFTFLGCLALYLNSNKEFKKQEKMFLSEFKRKRVVKIEAADEKEALSSSSIF